MGTGVIDESAYFATPEDEQRSVLELSNIAMKRQQQQAEIDRLTADMGYAYKQPGFQPQRQSVASAEKVADKYIEGQPTFSEGSRLQQLLESDIARIRNDTARARAGWANQLRKPMTMEEVKAGYTNKLGDLTGFLSTEGLSDEVRGNAQRMYQGTLKNWQSVTPEKLDRWNAYQAELATKDPLALALDKYDVNKSYYGLTASQRGQNVSRFRPALRF